jgi:hypothetical protein
LPSYLGEYGQSDIAVNVDEAIGAVVAAYSVGKPDDIVFMDIMLPAKDG